MKKILTIPTYFPTPQQPIVGSQIEEQTALLDQAFDVKVLYCSPGIGWKRHLLNSVIKGLGIDKAYLPPPINFKSVSSLSITSNFFFQNQNLSYDRNRKWMLEAYEALFINEFLQKGWKPDLIHSRGFDKAGIIANYLSNKFNIPYVHTENTAFLFDSSFSLQKLEDYKKVLVESKKIIFVSNFLARNTLMHGFLQNNQWEVVPNPIDGEFFKPATIAEEKNPKEIRILIAGYNSYIKDFKTLFKAVSVANSKNVSTKIIIAMTYGNAVQEAQLKNEAKKLGVTNLEIRISVERPQMVFLIQQVDVVVSSSIVETFGITLCEALFTGTPVISTRNGGAEDFVTENNGVLVDIGDFQAIAVAIENIYNAKIKFNPEEVRRSVLTKFGTKRFVTDMSNIYNSIN